MSGVASRERDSAMAPKALASSAATQSRIADAAIARLFLQPDTATAAGTGRIRTDQLDPGLVQGRDQLHQRIDVAANHVLAGFHALNGGDRQSRPLRQAALVDPKERPRRAHLSRRDHAEPIASNRALQ